MTVSGEASQSRGWLGGRGRASAALRRGVALLAVLATLVSGDRAARANPEWLDAFWDKAEGWGKRLEAALDRVEAAAKDAKAKLEQKMKERFEDLKRTLEENRDALKAVVEGQQREWAAVLEARYAQVTAAAEALADDLESIIRGTIKVFRGEAARLTTGVRQSVAAGLRDARVELGEARLVDGSVVAAAQAGTVTSLRRWGFILLIVAGALLVAVGVPLSFSRDRWLALALGLLGLGGIVFGAIQTVRERAARSTPVALGLGECPALAGGQNFLNQNPPPMSATRRQEASALRLALARCQALAADDTLARLTAGQLAKLDKAMGSH